MTYKFKWSDKKVGEYLIFITNNPNGTMDEFKELKRDWEILKFVHLNFTQHFWELNKDGKYVSNNETLTLTEILSTLSEGKKKIHTVKRLSDGQLFSLGKNAKCKNGEFVIGYISVYDDGKMMVCSDGESGYVGDYINKIQAA